MRGGGGSASALKHAERGLTRDEESQELVTRGRSRENVVVVVKVGRAGRADAPEGKGVEGEVRQ